MIAVIDYGVGNLFSLTASLKYLGADVKVTGEKEEIEAADRIILPGVGAFADAKEKLDQTGLVETILEQTTDGKPLLGICLGMQLLFDESHEYGVHKGLGLIKKSLQFEKDEPLFRYNKPGDYVYYVHSFYGTDCEESIIATSEYGVTVTGAVRSGKVYGTQFHPEKSGEAGLKMLKAFMEV